MDKSVIKQPIAFNVIKVFKKFQKYFSFAALVLVVLIFSILSDKFRTITNFINILNQSSTLIAAAVGQTLVILAGSIDLSVGSLLGLTAVLTALASHYFGDLAIIVGPIAGLAAGTLTGLIFSKGKIPSFITALAMQIILRGIVLMITKGQPIHLKSSLIDSIAISKMAGIPVIFIFAICVFLIGLLITEYRPIGRYIKAVGGEEKVAKLSGINIDKVKIIVFSICGFMTGIAGVLQVSRTMAGVPMTGQNFELDTISACVLGGTLLSGGIGTVGGTIVGAFTLTALSSGLNIIGVSPYGQYVAKGLVLIVAILITIDRSKIKVIK